MDNLLILDIDETLVRSSEHLINGLSCDYELLDYIGYKRPHLNEFLIWAFANFKIGIWSAGGERYVNHILEKILSEDQHPVFVYNRNHCTREFSIDPFDGEYPHEITTKKLNKLRKKFNLAKTLFLDDNSQVHKHNYGNHIHIREFHPGVEDTELLRVQPFIKEWFKAEDVRKIEKRGWSK